MTAQELIELLQKEDPKKRVVVLRMEVCTFPRYEDISGIELERITSPCDQDFDEYVVTLY